MASYSYSTSSSDISTPRSSSPASARSSNTSISYKRMSISSRRMTDFSNPMAGVDLATIEERMRAASLNQLRGYRQNTLGEVRQYRTAEYIPEAQAVAYQVLREPAWNRGKCAEFNAFDAVRVWQTQTPQQTPKYNAGGSLPCCIAWLAQPCFCKRR